MRRAGNPNATIHRAWAAAGGLWLWALVLSACPAVSSKPCSADADCPDGRCRRGACGPTCLDDGECGTDQTCQSGKCLMRPECARDDDCATGFTCTAGACLCQSDAACAANQACVLGQCQTQPRCRGDADCAGTGRRCEVTQGLCVPPCASAADCAPGLDPAIATALYQCFQGACSRHCLNDVTCGQGLICRDGLCEVSDCATMSDCLAGQYCTSATFGRCVEFKPCGSSSECSANTECRPFAQGQCPPGFPCQTPLCQELPTCLVDSDCGLAGNPLPGRDPAFCQDGHCQPTTTCADPVDCAAPLTCVGGLCVPGSCRGQLDCPSGEACVDGACGPAPAAGDIDRLRLTPKRATLEVGDTLRFSLVAFRLDGSSFPLAAGTFEVVDLAGAPSAAATVDATGLVTAVGPGELKIRGSVPGANVAAQEARLTVYAQVDGGRRVLVVEEASGLPIPGTVVRGCEQSLSEETCVAPIEATTSATGEALFPAFGPGPATFTAMSPAVRADGLPKYDRVSVVGVTAGDVYLPLSDNPVAGAAGFEASILFTDVHSTGAYWAGFAALSASDLPAVDLTALLGEPFYVNAPAIPQPVPVPGSVVLYTSPGLGIAREIKGQSYGLGQPGLRRSVAFAGRTALAQLASVRSVSVLAYAGALDYALQPETAVSLFPLVSDADDINGNGLCDDPTRCPGGTEQVPDYAHFARLSFTPRRQQNLRTEVVVPDVPASLDTVVVASVETSAEEGLFPLGFASGAAGVPQGGARPVDPIALRSGAPYGGAETATPGIWALATSAQAAGTSVSGDLTARLTHSATLPTRVLVDPFLPIAEGSTFTPATRAFSPGQPAWSDAALAGATLAELVISGADGRHRVYFALQADQTTVWVPQGPPGGGNDPAGEEAASVRVVVLDVAGVPADGVFTLARQNLGNLPEFLAGYSRFQL